MLKKGLKLIKYIEEKGFKAYIIGGAVRDYLIGVEPKDIDVTTDATPSEIMKIFPKYFPLGLKYGTVTVFFEDEEFEITTFRSDGEYKDSRRPESISFTKSLKEDVKRRDLTISSIAMDKDGKIIDYFGGASDIKEKTIKSVGSPTERFSEDALRILRAFRFSARFDFEIQKETLGGIKSTKELLKDISKERVKDEISKILMTKNVDKTFKLMYEVGIFDIILKELKLLFGLEQITPYHKYDVATHTFKAVESSKSDLVVKWALLLHDIGKSSTKTTEGSRDHFYKHPIKSVEIADVILKRLKFSTKERLEILELIKFHDKELTTSRKSVRKVLSKLEHTSLDRLLDVKLADVKAQADEFKYRIYDIESIRVLKADEKKLTVKDLSVNGHDLISLGLRGREIGKALDFLLEKVIEDKELDTKEKLFELLKPYLKR